MALDNQTLNTRFRTPASSQTKVDDLEHDLREAISGEVRFEAGSKAMYSTDASNYRQIPLGVVLPKTQEDILRILAICRKHHAPVLPRGGGTSLAGQGCNVAVVVDCSKYYNRILHLDKEKRQVTVQSGIVLDRLRNELEASGLTFGPDPATHSHCTIGGMLGNNSCGVHSVMAEIEGDGARMEDNVHSMTVVTYDGVKMTVGETDKPTLDAIMREGGRKKEIYRKLISLRKAYSNVIHKQFPPIPRRVSGYNLPELLPERGFNVARALVGSEGTCVFILEATLKLLPNPRKRTLLVLGYPSVFEAGDHVLEILKHKPVGLEGLDNKLINYMRAKDLHIGNIPLLPKGEGWLIAEFGGDSQEVANRNAKATMDALKKEENPPDMQVYEDPEDQQKIWDIRESGLGATAWVPGEADSFPGWEDSAVPPEKIGSYLRDLRKLFKKHNYHPSLYGHFAQGCVHCRVGFDLYTENGLRKYKKFTEEAAHLVARYGGSISGEHGDGQARGDLLEIMYGKELINAFREFKYIWDPEWKMNPGKIIDTYGQVSNLRVSEKNVINKPKTEFAYPDDQNDFTRAAMRCVGVGKCRRTEHGTMCPSYMVTLEEKHSTRGRARILYEMLEGDVVKNGWKDESVKEALDLCLSCKGCKSDCPVNVDMATYKAEFLSHYYKGRIRPRSAYFFGYIFRWARLASPIAGIANYFTNTRPFSNVLQWMAGVDQHRSLPRFARETFRNWFNKTNKQQSPDRPKVILWTDTFNNYFTPAPLKAAKVVLESAGYNVILPPQNLCCGRPLYDFGLIQKARKMLEDILTSLHDEIQARTPIVGLEPSCVATFRDELYNLFPDRKDAAMLKEQTYTLSEFLNSKTNGWSIPELQRTAIYHGHCHHKAIMGVDEDMAVMKKMNLNYKMLDSGCCGMAGYFGYEKGDHYEVSVKAGERVLLPAVREVGKETLIISDGFSCRNQIEQMSDRKGVHLAEVIAMAINANPSVNGRSYENKKKAKQERV